MFAANGAPHLIKGVIGQRHQTPFGKGSSAVVNVCWGWINLVAAAVLFHFGHVRADDYGALALLAVGILLMSLFSAVVWSTHPEFNE
jgi:hypothetical protein